MKSDPHATISDRNAPAQPSEIEELAKAKESDTTNQAVEADKRRDHLASIQISLRARKGLLACGTGFTAVLHESDRLLYLGSNRCGEASLGACRDVVAVVAAGDSAVALTADGQVSVRGRSASETEFATQIAGVRAVAIGRRHMAVLMVDGRVRVGGHLPRGHESVAEWSDITDVACGSNFTAGLCADGHVMMAGGTWLMRDSVSRWENMAGIVADPVNNTLYGIGEGGVLYATRRLPAVVQTWEKLVQISASGRRLCAVTSSGTLLSTLVLPPDVATGKSYIAVSVGRTHLAALSRDGKIIACGDNRYGQCNTDTLGRMFTEQGTFTARRRTRVSERQENAYAFRIRAAEAARFAGQLACSERVSACVNAYRRVLTQPSFSESKLWQEVRRVACGNAHILALRTDGRVLADGNRDEGCCDVSDWENMREIVAGAYHSLGVTFDGRVRFAGSNEYGQCDVSRWKNLRTVRTTDTYTVGLTTDGQVLVAGTPPFDPQGLSQIDTPITDVRITNTHMLCLLKDGRVFATWPTVTGVRIQETAEADALPAPIDTEPVTSRNEEKNILSKIRTKWKDKVQAKVRQVRQAGQVRQAEQVRQKETEKISDFSDGFTGWREIASIAAYGDISVGLRYGGTVCAVGISPQMQAEIAAWRGIVAIGCGSDYIVGLGHDGHLHVAGAPALTKDCHTAARGSYSEAATPMYSSFEVAEHWQDIIAFACAPTHLLALNRDGQVLACGSDSDGQCSVTTHFTLFRDARSLSGYGQYRLEEEVLPTEADHRPTDAHAETPHRRSSLR